MKGRVVVLSEYKNREAAALMVGGRLQDFLVHPGPNAPVGPGAIFRAVADRQMKGQGGVFLRLPKGRAFLRGAKGVRPGESLLVQVTGYAEPGKAIPVTTRLLFKSRYAIITPHAPGLNISRRIREDEALARLHDIAAKEMAGAESGLILRSAAEHAQEDDIAQDISSMRDIAERVMAETGAEPEHLLEAPGAHHLAWREWSEPTPDAVCEGKEAFSENGVLDELEYLTTPNVPLDGHASMWIEPTRALVAVDVNTGSDTSPAAGLKANLAAARDLPRQLRLRGLGGQVTIDFAPLPKKDRRTLEGALRSAFKTDPIETALVGWTPLGHYELQRKRERMVVEFAL